MAKPEDTIEADRPKDDLDDPLAELARIVSAGSVFGDANQPPRAEPQAVPVPPAPVAEAPEPQVSAPVEPPVVEPSPVASAMPSEPAAPPTPVEVPQPEADLETLLGNELEAELAQQFEPEAPVAPVQPQPSVVESAPSIAPDVSEPLEAAPQEPVTPQVDFSLFEGELAPEPAPPPPPVPEDVTTVPEPAPEKLSQPAPSEPAPVETFETEESAEDDDPISSFIEGEINKAQRDLESDADLALRELSQIASPKPEPSPEPNAHADIAVQSAAALESALLLDGFEEVTKNDKPAEPVKASAGIMPPGAGDPTAKPDIDFGAFEAELSLDPSPSAAKGDGDPINVFFDDPNPSDIGQVNLEMEEQPALDDEFEHLNDMPAEEAGKKKGRALLLVVGVLVLTLIGSVVYLVLGLTSESDTPLIVTADDSPVRVRPEDPGGKVIPNQDNPVFDRLSNGDRQNENESILLRDDADGPLLVDRNSSDSGDSASSGVSATTPNLGPKRVRTVVIRTDGTPIIPSEDEVLSTATDSTNAASGLAARNTQLPPAISTSENSLAETGDNVADNLSLRGTNSPDQGNTVISETPAETAVESPAAETAATESEQRTVVAALPPVPRPNTLISRTPQAQNNTAAVETSSSEPLALQAGQANSTPSSPPATTPPAATTNSDGFNAPSPGIGNFLVQLSSQRTEAQAQTTFNTLARRYSFLSAYSPNIRRVDLGDRGIYHRVRIGPFSRAEAARLCTELKSRGGDCILAANR